MMFVDASAIVAILADEPEKSILIQSLSGPAGNDAFTSPLAVYEASMAIARIRACDMAVAEREVRIFLLAGDLAVDPPTDAHAHEALEAFWRFGKGRHRAALNMGDCFSYASAKLANAPILFVGDDFVHTDLATAP
jgi:ribonuclease VapC